jgi:hypothetical protein
MSSSKGCGRKTLFSVRYSIKRHKAISPQCTDGHEKAIGQFAPLDRASGVYRKQLVQYKDFQFSTERPPKSIPQDTRPRKRPLDARRSCRLRRVDVMKGKIPRKDLKGPQITHEIANGMK